MSRFRIVVLATIFMAMLVACRDEAVCEEIGDGQVKLFLNLQGTHDQLQVRSILGGESIETRMTDVSLAAYDSDGNLVNTTYSDCVADGVSVYLSASKLNSVYALVNMGDMTRAFPLNEEDLPEMVYMLDSYEDIAEKGIPMCGVARDCLYQGDRPVSIAVERLLARLDVRILHTGLKGASAGAVTAYNMCNKSLYLRQANRRILPFCSDGSKAVSADDVLSISDYNPDLDDPSAYEGNMSPSQFGPGVGYVQDTTIVLYVPENVQGVLLPGNIDPFSKTRDRISDIDGKSYEGLCTYLELNVSKPDKGEGFSGDLTYRCYLGEDNVSDFSVRRNMHYDLTISLTDEGFHLDNWKVVRGDNWSDIRALNFVDEPYVIYPGTVTDVLLHYHRTSQAVNVDSSGSVDELEWEFDAEGLLAAGVLCEFMGDEKAVGKNGRSDYFFRLTASPDAVTDWTFPIRVSTKDGVKSDVVQVYVSQIGALTPVWDFCPGYVSQTGVLTVAGAIDGLRPVVATVSDPSVLSCRQLDDDSFAVTALRPGGAQILVSNRDGSQQLALDLEIKAPRLRVSDVSVALNPDGEPACLDYQYLDEKGGPITHVDESAFRTFLMPKVSEDAFVGIESDMSSVRIFIDRIYYQDVVVPVGSYREMKISAADCQQSGSQVLRIFFVDPFNGMPPEYDGRLDDYSLFEFADVPSAVRDYFKQKTLDSPSTQSIKYQVPQLKADPLYISSSLTPLWLGDFSFENGMFGSGYLHSDLESELGASVAVCRNPLNVSAYHSAGKHELKLHVKNRHSGELLSRRVAMLDVYVHTAVGASAYFGSVLCSDVASVYNSVAGANLYSVSSSSWIWYADVSLEYLTVIDKVRVFSTMSQATSSHRNILNSLDVVRPSVSDGYRDTNLRRMYSVCVGGGQRTAVCSEAYGMRKGIGAMLYRVLAVPARTEVLTQMQLKELFLGYNPAQGAVSSVYSPSYSMHDMNLGSDMQQNQVSKAQPFYFSPVDFHEKRDAEGRGYHVIHTLESIAPQTGGWIDNL